MRVSPGDIVYDAKGRPGVVETSNRATGKVVSERKGPAFEKARRFGFVNGMTPNERQSYQQVMSDVRSIQDPTERISLLSEKVSELEDDPSKLQLARYLRAEMSHLMFSSRVFPKTFEMDENSI